MYVYLIIFLRRLDLQYLNTTFSWPYMTKFPRERSINLTYLTESGKNIIFSLSMKRCKISWCKKLIHLQIAPFFSLCRDNVIATFVNLVRLLCKSVAAVFIPSQRNLKNYSYIKSKSWNVISLWQWKRRKLFTLDH